MITVIKRDGRTEPLDIAKIQKYTYEMIGGMIEECSQSTHQDVSKRKALLQKIRLKVQKISLLKQYLFETIKSLSKLKNSIIHKHNFIQNLLHNIFGNNNSSEPNHNK